MIYDVTGHAKLSQAAHALAPDLLAAEAIVAETVLGLVGTAYTEEKYDRAAVAVALQISYQVDADIEGFILQSASRGGRSVSYRTAGKKGLPIAHPLAKKIADSLKPTRSIRTR